MAILLYLKILANHQSNNDEIKRLPVEDSLLHLEQIGILKIKSYCKTTKDTPCPYI